MSVLSVVIITRNEENNIIDCIRSAKQVSNDIIVVDCGSEDLTVQMAQAEGARTFVISWQGFGFSRNYGAAQARHNWILALDADERISEALAFSIKRTEFFSENQLVKFGRVNYIGDERINYGTLGFERVKMIYNRKCCELDQTLVHEKLISAQPLTTRKIKGQLIHFGLKSFEDYKNRSVLYAQMSAEKYLLEGRKNSLLKRVGSPFFNALKSYIFQLGFLEGKKGFRLAKTIAYYSWLKYYYLHQLRSETENPMVFSAARKMETISN